jgi:hypothetical protein
MALRARKVIYSVGGRDPEIVVVRSPNTMRAVRDAQDEIEKRNRVRILDIKTLTAEEELIFERH